MKLPVRFHDSQHEQDKTTYMGWLIKAEAALRQLGVLHILDDSPPTRQSVAADNTELNPKNAAQVAGFA